MERESTTLAGESFPPSRRKCKHKRRQYLPFLLWLRSRLGLYLTIEKSKIFMEEPEPEFPALGKENT